MPSPATTNLPRPKSWDEFEDICADVLKRLWRDPYVVRNGRSGQSQNGVDCYGLPEHLGGASAGKYCGAQCKLTEVLSLRIIQDEVGKAENFEPHLTEYILMTTASRDSRLQEDVRTQNWPFDRVQIMFWEDISLELSGHEDLLQKHFPGWMTSTTKEEKVKNMLLSSDSEDYRYDDQSGEFFLKSDVLLRIVLERGERSGEEFNEPWVKRFPDQHATRQPVYICYCQTKVIEVFCVYVDGARHIIPLPQSASELTITNFQYRIGKILNEHNKGSDFDSALSQARIEVRENDNENGA